MYYVYVLYSERDAGLYIGYTCDLTYFASVLAVPSVVSSCFFSQFLFLQAQLQ